MTNEQAVWLHGHPNYEPLGVAGSGAAFTKVEHLLPNGTLASAAASPSNDGQGRQSPDLRP